MNLARYEPNLAKKTAQSRRFSKKAVLFWIKSRRPIVNWRWLGHLLSTGKTFVPL
jgi:hypothetical protein